MSDGRLEIDTELDTTGLSKGMSGLKTGMKTAGVAIGAATTAIAGLVGASVKAYASYEQLVGGVDTLFKESSQKVQQYAANAYKTAGMSSNQYMETVTGFSASLLQSLGGDTNKAADYANQAITDMSDNANKMGTNMQDIQNAYQGFAKQNYTMLDNLKLGYGGTKEEMQRLLDDASKISGQKFDISSYADVTKAIHVVQTEMGITGTTAKEAATTIEGSVNMTKAAWSNLIVGIADDNANFSQLIDNFVKSAGTAFKNIMPRVQQSLLGIGQLIEQLLPIIISEIPNIITEVLPKLLDSGVNMIIAIVDGLVKALPQLITSAGNIITSLILKLGEATPQIITTIAKAIPVIVKSLVTAIPQIVDAVMKAVPLIVQAIFNSLPILIEAGLKILLALVQGIAQATPQLMNMIPQIITGIIDALASAIPLLIEYAPQIILAIISGLISAIPKLVAAVPKITLALINGLAKASVKLILLGAKFISWLWSGISGAIGGFTSKIWNFAKSIPGKIADGVGSLASVGRNIIVGFWNGIGNAKDWLVSKISGFFGGIKDSIKDFFGIHSPSRVMRDEIGRYLVYGLGDGIINNAKYAVDAVKALSNKVKDAFDDNMTGLETEMIVSGVDSGIDSGILNRTISANLISANSTEKGNTVVNQTINFNQPATTPSETARMMKQQATYGLAGDF